MNIITKFFYIALGVLPVTFWIIWSPFYLFSFKLVPFIIGISMILGAVGMYLTLASKNKSIKFRMRVCFLLLVGELMMLFAMFGMLNMFKQVPYDMREVFFYYATIGPLLVALHYQASFIYQTTFNKAHQRIP